MPETTANLGSAISTDFATQPRTTSFPTSGNLTTKPRVLVVEDDAVNLRTLQRLLEKWGYEVIATKDVIRAEEAVSRVGAANLDCVVTDHLMPGKSGLDLLSWIKRKDASLSTIIVTAQEERTLIAESLRGGAFDFLDKPVDPERLRLTVAQAVQASRRQRHLANSESAMKELGRAQEWMLGVGSSGHEVSAEVCFYPKHEAGGDFFSHFRPNPDQLFCLLTDVSGHDAQAAYISAYCQGLARGMVEEGAGISEIFKTFNRILSEEWNGYERGEARLETVTASVAACGVIIDSTRRTATVLSHGIPAPVYCDPEGRAEFLGNNGGYPLGWFKDLTQANVVQDVVAGVSLCLWTDGLDDLADKMGVSPLSAALALERGKSRNRRPADLAKASDDILFANIRLPFDEASANYFRPLIVEKYPGDSAAEIDRLQRRWQRSLRMGVPYLVKSVLHDILLASREAALNAFQHGCRNRPESNVSFQVSYSQLSHIVRVRVSDPGPGHQFDFEAHDRDMDGDLKEAHRGLILIKRCATKLKIECNGASVVMDFTWNEKQNEPAGENA